MRTLATKVVAKSNGVDEKLPDDLLKSWPDYKGKSLVSNEKSPSISAVRLMKEEKNLTINFC